MNWVGGSRNRLMIKNDARKQREFFEKKRIEKKMQDLGLPGAPEGQSGGSLDLLTLFIVNQIAAKKEQHSSIKHDTPKVTHVNKGKRVQRSITEGPINLPMSPCSPSRLCLGESQSCYGAQGTMIKESSSFQPQTQSYRHLSPVLESSFSDGSISDYQHHPADTLSPFSLAASDSSSGAFALQHRPELKQSRDKVTASSGAQHNQNSSVTRVHFGSMESNYLGRRGLALQTAVGHRSFIHENQENLEQMLFMDFDDRAGHSESENFEIDLKGKSPPYSAVFCDLKKSQYAFPEHDFWSQTNSGFERVELSLFLLAKNASENSVPKQKQVPESTQSYEPSCWSHSSGTPSYSSRGGILSTNSDDEDQCQRKTELWKETCSSDNSTGLLPAVCLHGKTKGTAYAVLQVKKPTADSAGDQQNPSCTGGKKRKRGDDQSVAASLQPGTLCSQETEMQLENSLITTKETATQTDRVLMRHTSVQCNLGQKCDKHMGTERVSLPAPHEHITTTDMPTRGQLAQGDNLLESAFCTAVPRRYRAEKYPRWRKSTAGALCHLRCGVTGQTSLCSEREIHHSSDEHASLKSTTMPHIKHIIINNTEERRGELKIEQTERAANAVQSAGLGVQVLHDPAEGVNEVSKEELGAEGITFTCSEEMVVLQEMANILLMLKERSGSE